MNKTEQFLRKNIGKKIKLARSKTNYTQEELAEKLSLSTRYISQLERGIAFGSATTIINLCKTLNINSDFLFQDLIQNDTPVSTDMIDIKFLENYLKLDNHNKTIINAFTGELLKIQKMSTEEKKA